MFAYGTHVSAAYGHRMTQIRVSAANPAWQLPRPANPVRPSGAASRHPLRAFKESLASAGVRRPRVLRGERTETPFDAPTVRTARLVLRPHRFSTTDVDDWFALQSEPSVVEYLPWPERDRRLSARHLRDRTRHTRLWQADDFLALAVVRDGRLIGDVSLHLRRVAAATRSVEIGWVLHPSFGGSGYATEAARAMLAVAFDAVGAHEVTAVTDGHNCRSVALAKRLGFTETGAGADGGAGSGEITFALARPRVEHGHTADPAA